jgi:hypothetical protein
LSPETEKGRERKGRKELKGATKHSYRGGISFSFHSTIGKLLVRTICDKFQNDEKNKKFPAGH